jgi:hypothetical protein
MIRRIIAIGSSAGACSTGSGRGRGSPGKVVANKTRVREPHREPAYTFACRYDWCARLRVATGRIAIAYYVDGQLLIGSHHHVGVDVIW